MTVVLPDPKPDDPLGRRLRKQNELKKNGKVRNYRVFFEPTSNKISVDRLGYASDSTVAQIARRELRPQYTLIGWAVVAVREAARDGRKVRADPTASNPYHAIIVIPSSGDQELRRELHRSAARKLQVLATFKPAPAE